MNHQHHHTDYACISILSAYPRSGLTPLAALMMACMAVPSVASGVEDNIDAGSAVGESLSEKTVSAVREAETTSDAQVEPIPTVVTAQEKSPSPTDTDNTSITSTAEESNIASDEQKNIAQDIQNTSNQGKASQGISNRDAQKDVATDEKTDETTDASKGALDKLSKVADADDNAINPDAILPEWQQSQAAKAEAPADSTETDKKDKPAPNFFKRVYQKYFGDEIGEVEKILVSTNVLDEAALVENVQQALSQITVDEFADFRLILPRLRSMARDAAKAVGYYDARFVFRQLTPTLLSVEITAGAPVTIAVNNVKIQGAGAQDAALQKILSQHAMSVGDTFHSGTYDTLKASLMLEAQRLGYFDSRWLASQVQVRLPQNRATVNLVLQTGERYRFGEVLYRDRAGKPYHDSQIKQIAVEEKLLKQLKTFQTGELFEQQKIAEFAANAISTKYFSSVDVTVIRPEPEKQGTLRFRDESTTDTDDKYDTETTQETEVIASAAFQTHEKKDNQATQIPPQQMTDAQLKQHAYKTKRVPIRVVLDSARPNTAEVGVGYGTDTGFRVRTKASRNLLNRRGHQATVNAEASKIRQALELSYERPFKDPLNDTVTFFAGYERDKRDSGTGVRDLTIDGVTAGVQRNIRRRDWQHSVSLTYYLDRLTTDLSDLEIEKLPVQFNTSRNQQSFLLGYGAIKTKFRGGLNPYQGYKQFYKAEVGSKDALSDASLIKLRAGANGLYSFGDERQHQVIAAIDVGTMLTSEFNNVPYKLRYFAGGDRSIRGYDYKTLSPKKRGYLTGGQHLATASLEYNYEVYEKWRVAAFADVGNAYNEKFSNETKIGAGLGVRWASPVGPMRIDVAAGVKESSVPIRLHFFIGPPF